MDIARTTTILPGETAVGLDAISLERGGKRLFERMTWTVPAGSFLAVTGPSGAGKSSLLACLRGSLVPSSGTFSFSIGDPRLVGTIFQHLRLTNELSVLTNVLCGCLGDQPWWKTLFSFGTDNAQRAYKIISELGLAELAHKPVRRISGGEQQRTAIARVLLQDPEIIFADEPTSNLDQRLAEQVLARFRDLCTRRGRTVISVLHDRDLVERFADFELKIGPDYDNSWMLRTISRA